jgi:DNA-binding transcriptional MerR regulator
MAELSSRSGTSIPSIKFYLREGLLPSGEATGRNQAEYGEAHLHRLRLIRALIDVGGVSVAGAREVLAAVDTPDLPGHHLLGAASYSLSRTSRRNTDDPIWQEARTEIAALIRQRGWLVDDAAPFIDHAADAVAALRALGQEDMLAMMPTYLEAVERIAGQEVDLVISRAEPARMVEGVITGTVLGEALFNALRRLAQQDASARRLLSPEEIAAYTDPTAHSGADKSLRDPVDSDTI